VALNWVRSRQSTIPILGARSAAQLHENMRCLDYELDVKQLQRLDDVSRIELGFPYDFLASNEIRNLVFGGTFGQIDTDRVR
jgi:diketogulonate reductase-like aldo/keto reductase